MRAVPAGTVGRARVPGAARPIDASGDDDAIAETGVYISRLDADADVATDGCRRIGRAQLVRGELNAREFFAFLGEVAGRPQGRSIGAVLVAVEGMKDGRRLRIQTSHADYQGGEEGGLDMDDWTGTPLAVFASMLLDGSIDEKGVLAPEACVDPAEFRKRMSEAIPEAEEAMKVEISEL